MWIQTHRIGRATNAIWLQIMPSKRRTSHQSTMRNWSHAKKKQRLNKRREGKLTCTIHDACGMGWCNWKRWRYILHVFHRFAIDKSKVILHSFFVCRAGHCVFPPFLSQQFSIHFSSLALSFYRLNWKVCVCVLLRFFAVFRFLIESKAEQRSNKTCWCARAVGRPGEWRSSKTRVWN